MVWISKPLKQNDIKTRMAINEFEQKFCVIEHKTKANKYRQLIANNVGEKNDHNLRKFYLRYKKYCFLKTKLNKLLKNYTNQCDILQSIPPNKNKTKCM